MRTLLSLLLLGGSLWLPAAVLAHGVTSEQIKQVTALIQHEPQNPHLYLRRGELYRRSGNARAALDDYAQSEKLAPQLSEVHFLRARLYFETRTPELAELSLDRLLAQHPQHTEALLLRAEVRAQLGATTQAIADYNAVLARHTQPKPEHYLARAELQLAARRPDDSLAGLEEGLAKLGPLVVLHQRALEIEVQRKRWDAALARLDTLLAQAPRQEFWLVRRSEILWQAGRRAAARQSRQAALAAIAALPDHLRHTLAMQQLQRRCRKIATN